MVKSVWKPAAEIETTLRMLGARRVTVLACGACAALSNTGGYRGLRYLTGLLRSWGIEVVSGKVFPTLCPEESTRWVLNGASRAIESSDALVMLSCSGGVKAAFLCDPGVPVVAVLDTVGSTPVSRSEDPVARSTCGFCEHCVITFTGGICPLSSCPAGSLYRPCSRYPAEGEACALNPGIDCVWKEIERRGDPAALRELSRIHREHPRDRIVLSPQRSSPELVRRLSGWVVAHARGFARLVPFID